MATMRDNFWIWGHVQDGHYGMANSYNLPGHSRMTALEGCLYFGIPNLCFVKIQGKPVPLYDQESIVLDPLKQVVWSLLGAGGEEATEWGDLDEVIRQAKMHDNVTGGVFDDFFSQKRMAIYTPDKLQTIKDRFVKGVGRPLSMWVVYYERELGIDVAKHFEPFDVITFWTWYGENLVNLEKNLDQVIAMSPGKRVLAGCYMWDYGNKKPLTIEQMEYQCAIYKDYMLKGKIEGIIFCSHVIADLGIEACDWTRQWIKQVGDIELT
jgi:hypothetical protein